MKFFWRSGSSSQIGIWIDLPRQDGEWTYGRAKTQDFKHSGSTRHIHKINAKDVFTGHNLWPKPEPFCVKPTKGRVPKEFQKGRSPLFSQYLAHPSYHNIYHIIICEHLLFTTGWRLSGDMESFGPGGKEVVQSSPCLAKRKHGCFPPFSCSEDYKRAQTMVFTQCFATQRDKSSQNAKHTLREKQRQIKNTIFFQCFLLCSINRVHWKQQSKQWRSAPRIEELDPWHWDLATNPNIPSENAPRQPKRLFTKRALHYNYDRLPRLTMVGEDHQRNDWFKVAVNKLESADCFRMGFFSLGKHRNQLATVGQDPSWFYFLSGTYQFGTIFALKIISAKTKGAAQQILLSHIFMIFGVYADVILDWIPEVEISQNDSWWFLVYAKISPSRDLREPRNRW